MSTPETPRKSYRKSLERADKLMAIMVVIAIFLSGPLADAIVTIAFGGAVR